MSVLHHRKSSQYKQTLIIQEIIETKKLYIKRLHMEKKIFIKVDWIEWIFCS